MSASAARARSSRERWIGWFCALGVLLVWVAFQLAGRASTRQSLTPWDVAALRYAGAFVAVLPVVLRRGVPRLPHGQRAALVATSGFGFPIAAYVGFAYAPVALGAVVMFGALPIVTAFAGWLLFHERPSRTRLLSLPVIAAGTAMIWAATVGSGDVWRGATCFLVAVVCLALFTLLLRRWGVPAFKAVMTLSLFAAPLYLPVWLVALPSHLWSATLASAIFQMIMQGVVTAVVAIFMYARAVNALGAGPPTLVAALVPGLASLGAWLLLGERLDLLGIAGVTVATAGMVIGVVPPRARAA